MKYVLIEQKDANKKNVELHILLTTIPKYLYDL